jgi:hypothetical protein
VGIISLNPVIIKTKFKPEQKTMALPLHKNESSTMQMRGAVVKQIAGSTYFVADSNSLARADRAASCLLEPQQGDYVLVSETCFRACYILTVLERQCSKPATVSVEGNLILESQDGNLSLNGGQSLNLVTPEIRIQASKGRIRFRDFTFSGTVVTTWAKQLRAVYATVETRADRAVERVNRLYRRIRDEDSRFDRLSCRVKGRFGLRARDASLDAEKRMRLNGDKIELG